MNFFKKILFCFLLTGSLGALAQSCDFRLQVKYPDGEIGCISDLPIAKEIVNAWGGQTVLEIVKNTNTYSLAASASCPGVFFRRPAGQIESPVRMDEAALATCPKECECAVVIRSGKSLVSKSLAMALGVPQGSELAKQNTEQAQKLKEQEQAQQIQAAKLKQQQLADEALAKEQQHQAALAKVKEQEQLALAEKLRTQQKFQEEAELKEQLRLAQVAKQKEQEQLAQAAKLREQQRQLDEALLKEQDRKLQEAKRQEEERVAQASRISDRELLLQLSAELARLRAEAAAAAAAAAKNTAQSGTVASVATPPVSVPQVVSAPAPLPIFANRKALVMGNDSYKFVSKLANAREDAKVMADNLTSVGYKVTLKLDLSEKEMKAALRGFKAQVEAGDEVAFFYAGHGVQLANSNYLVPIDVAGEGEEQMKDEGISLQRILDDMSEKKAKFTLAMIDACRDNPFKSNGRAVGGNSRGLAPTTAATGQMVVFSAGTGQQALDKLGPNDKDKNGLFTRIFVREMQKPGVSVDRVVRNVRGEVVSMAKSVGHEQVPAIYDQVVGEFYFRK
jgi:actin-related protein